MMHYKSQILLHAFNKYLFPVLNLLWFLSKTHVLMGLTLFMQCAYTVHSLSRFQLVFIFPESVPFSSPYPHQICYRDSLDAWLHLHVLIHLMSTYSFSAHFELFITEFVFQLSMVCTGLAVQ